MRETTEEKYEEIMNIINNKQRQEGKGYKLKDMDQVFLMS